jgi:hypothetical protein
MKYLIIILAFLFMSCDEFREEEKIRVEKNKKQFDALCVKKMKLLRPLYPIEKGRLTDFYPYQRIYKSGDMVLECTETIGTVVLQPMFGEDLMWKSEAKDSCLLEKDNNCLLEKTDR